MANTKSTRVRAFRQWIFDCEDGRRRHPVEKIEAGRYYRLGLSPFLEAQEGLPANLPVKVFKTTPDAVAVGPAHRTPDGPWEPRWLPRDQLHDAERVTKDALHVAFRRMRRPHVRQVREYLQGREVVTFANVLRHLGASDNREAANALRAVGWHPAGQETIAGKRVRTWRFRGCLSNCTHPTTTTLTEEGRNSSSGDSQVPLDGDGDRGVCSCESPVTWSGRRNGRSKGAPAVTTGAT